MQNFKKNFIISNLRADSTNEAPDAFGHIVKT